MARYLLPPTPPEDLPPPPPAPRDLDIPDEAWGSRLAFGLLQPGEALDPTSRELAGTANITRAAELQNQFLDRQRQILHTGPDAFLDTTGRDAVLGADAVLARLDAARQDTLDQAGTEAQRRLLREALGEHRSVEYATVGDHVGRQTRAWRHATAAARLDQLHQQAALDYADPGTIEALHAASDSTLQELARTRPQGNTGTSFMPEPNDTPSIWRIAIEAALGRLDYPGSIVLHARAGDRIDPAERALLDPLIAAAREHLAGQDYLNGVAPPDTHDLAALDTAHQAATAQNEADWPDNPSQRATNQHFIDVAFGTRKRDAVKARADLTQAVTDWLDQPAPDGSPQTQRPPLALWTRLNDDERRTLDARLAQNANPRLFFHPDLDGPPPVEDAPPEDRPAEPGPPEPPQQPAPAPLPDFEAGRALTDWLARHLAGGSDATDPRPSVSLPPAEQAALDALLKARADGAADTATVPAVRDAIERGLTSDDPRERLKWAREPLYRYKSLLSDDDFARLAHLQRQISPYDGYPREGLGHPIGTLDDNARLALALLPGGIARPMRRCTGSSSSSARRSNRKSWPRCCRNW
ncbi:MAG: hypothetical protein JSR90_18855 [Proteobacteria bacterium]|nr:hypothetical protein [Pseudomonadota bacterium]